MRFDILNTESELTPISDQVLPSIEDMDFSIPEFNANEFGTEMWVDDMIIGDGCTIGAEGYHMRDEPVRSKPYTLMQEIQGDKSIVHIRLHGFISDDPQLLLILGMANVNDEIDIFFDTCEFSSSFQKAMMNAIKYSKAKVTTFANGIFDLSALLVWLSGHVLKVGPFSRLQFGDRSIMKFGSRLEVAEGLEHANRVAEAYFKYVVEHKILTVEEYEEIIARKSSIGLFGKELFDRVRAANAVKQSP